jgi:hypothetical protein
MVTVTRIEPEPRRVDDDFGECGDVLQSHIEPLPGDRMDEMGGVANERDALGDERAGDEKAERMHAARTDRFDLAEMQLEALFKLGMKSVIRQRHDAFCLVGRLGPHDRGAVALQRQDRERAGGQKMLLGAAAMIALVADGGDDRRLIVSPAVCRNAGALADLRARAIGGNKKPRCHHAAIGNRDVEMM